MPSASATGRRQFRRRRQNSCGHAEPDPGRTHGDAPGSILGPQSALTPRDRDTMIRTVYGEASNQAPIGQQAVANVILNRARMAGTSPEYEARKKNQFEPWWNASARARMEALSPDSPAYQRASAAVDAALTGEDPTRGATHFYSPSVQAKLGRRMPSWDTGEGEMIGTHRFFRKPYGGQQPGAPPRTVRALSGRPGAMVAYGLPPMPPPEALEALHSRHGGSRLAAATATGAAPGGPTAGAWRAGDADRYRADAVHGAVRTAGRTVQPQ